MIDGLTLVEAGHFNREFDRCAISVDAQGSIAVLGDGNDATVDLWRELAIDFDFLFAGGFPLLQRRIIQVWKSDGAFDLQRAVAFEKNRCRMGIDPMDTRMRGRIRQKCKDALLHAGIG